MDALQPLLLVSRVSVKTKSSSLKQRQTPKKVDRDLLIKVIKLCNAAAAII